MRKPRKLSFEGYSGYALFTVFGVYTHLACWHVRREDVYALWCTQL